MSLKSKWLWCLVLGIALVVGLRMAAGPLTESVFSWVARKTSPWSVTWADLETTHLFRYKLRSFRIDTGRGELKAESATARISGRLFPLLIQVEMVFTRPSIRIRSISKTYEFQRGRYHLEWTPEERLVRYSEWVSPALTFSGEGRYDRSGQMTELVMEGMALRSYLSQWLSYWKTFKFEEDLPMSFRIHYREGEFSIQLDGKPFFKAHWY